MNAMNTRRDHSYDALTNTLTVTASFLKKASVLNSPEYQLLMQCRRENPDVTIVPADSKRKPSNKSITFKQMEAYIAIFDDEQKTIKAQFEKIKSMSKIQASPYKYVKVWFEKQFPNYKDQATFNEKGEIVYEKGPSEKTAEQDETQEPSRNAA